MNNNNNHKLNAALLKKLRFINVLPFIVWPLVFCVAFFIMYNSFFALYIRDLEYRSENTSYQVEKTFNNYLTQIDNTLKGTVATLEYMLDNDVSEEEMLRYITYESERMGIVSSTGSRGIFGVFGGKFLHGLGWNPENYDPTQRVWYQEAVKHKGEYCFVGPYFNKRTDEYVVTAVKLLKDGESVIAFAIDYETFKNMTTSTVNSDENHMVLAMNENGVVLANSNNDEMGEDYSASEDSFKKGLYNGIMANQGKITFSLENASAGKSNYIVSRRHVLYDLYVVIVTNEDVELADLRKSVYIFGGILIAGMIIILCLNLITLSKDLAAKQKAADLSSISNIYVTVHRIDLTQNTFEQITCIDYKASKILDDPSIAATDMMKAVMTQMVDERSRDAMIDFTDISTLNDRMKGRDTITEEFLSYEHVWHRARFIVVDRDIKGKLKDVIFATEIIDDEKRARDRFQYLAETDQLTGINNRGSGENKIRDLLLKNVGGMFILFDVDKFKFVNDHFGHDVGDEVLIAIGEVMHRSFREKDIIMRLGGDEFAAYMPSVFTEAGAGHLLERFIENVHKMHVEALGDYKINISIGAAFYYPTDTFKFEELYRRADSCTYESKKIEGSLVTFYKRKDSEHIETDLP